MWRCPTAARATSLSLLRRRRVQSLHQEPWYHTCGSPSCTGTRSAGRLALRVCSCHRAAAHFVELSILAGEDGGGQEDCRGHARLPVLRLQLRALGMGSKEVAWMLALVEPKLLAEAEARRVAAPERELVQLILKNSMNVCVAATEYEHLLAGKLAGGGDGGGSPAASPQSAFRMSPFIGGFSPEPPEGGSPSPAAAAAAAEVKPPAPAAGGPFEISTPLEPESGSKDAPHAIERHRTSSDKGTAPAPPLSPAVPPQPPAAAAAAPAAPAAAKSETALAMDSMELQLQALQAKLAAPDWHRPATIPLSSPQPAAPASSPAAAGRDAAAGLGAPAAQSGAGGGGGGGGGRLPDLTVPASTSERKSVGRMLEIAAMRKPALFAQVRTLPLPCCTPCTSTTKTVPWPCVFHCPFVANAAPPRCPLRSGLGAGDGAQPDQPRHDAGAAPREQVRHHPGVGAGETARKGRLSCSKTVPFSSQTGQGEKHCFCLARLLSLWQ